MQRIYNQVHSCEYFQERDTNSLTFNIYLIEVLLSLND